MGFSDLFFNIGADQLTRFFISIVYSIILVGSETLLLLLFTLRMALILNYNSNPGKIHHGLCAAVFTGTIIAAILNYFGLGETTVYFLSIMPAFAVYVLQNRYWVKGGVFNAFLIYCLNSLFFIMLQYIYIPVILFYSGYELDFFYALPYRLIILFMPGRAIQAAITLWLYCKSPIKRPNKRP